MSELKAEGPADTEVTVPVEPEGREGIVIAVVSILAVAVVLLGCMCSCVVIAYFFMSNPPW